MSSGRTFKKAEIKAWQDELTRIPQDVANAEAQIHVDHVESEKIVSSLAKVRETIRPIDTNIKALSARKQILENQQQVLELQKVIAEQQAILKTIDEKTKNASQRYDEAMLAVNQFPQRATIRSAQQTALRLPQQIREQEAKLSGLDSSVRVENSAITALNYTISSLQTDVSRLTQEAFIDTVQHSVAQEAHGHGHHDMHHSVAQVGHGYGHHDMHHSVAQVGHGYGHHDVHHSAAQVGHSYGHHDAHDHHTHQPTASDLFGAMVHAVVDVDRDLTLSRKRGELEAAQRQQTSHYRSLERLQREIASENQALQLLQSQRSQNQNWLLATHSHIAELDRLEGIARQIDHELGLLRGDFLYRFGMKERDQNQISAINIQNARLAEEAKSYAANNDIDDLSHQIAQAQQLKTPHAEQENSYLQQQANLQEGIRESQRKVTRLKSRQIELNKNKFLITLRDNPMQLQAEFVAAYEAAVKKFDAENPADQSEREQIALREMKADVAFIQSHVVVPNGMEGQIQSGATSSSSNETSDSEGQLEGQVKTQSTTSSLIDESGLSYHPARLKLYQLCGLLITKKTAIHAGERDSRLAAELKTVIDQYPLDAEEARSEYQRLNLPLMTAADLLAALVTDYEIALNNLSVRATQIPKDRKEWKTLAAEAIALIDSIEKNRSKNDFNIVFYTKVLVAADALLGDPTNEDKQKAFNDLVVLDKIGRANNCKRGSGALSMFLGAALGITTYLADRAGYLESVPSVHGNAKYAGYSVGGVAFVAGLRGFFKGQPDGSFKHGCDLGKAAHAIPKFFVPPQVQQHDMSQPGSGEGLQAPLLSAPAPSAPSLSPRSTNG